MSTTFSSLWLERHSMGVTYSNKRCTLRNTLQDIREIFSAQPFLRLRQYIHVYAKYIYIYIYIYICIHTYIHTYIQIYIWHTWYIYVYTYIYIYIYIYIHIHLFTNYKPKTRCVGVITFLFLTNISVVLHNLLQCVSLQTSKNTIWQNDL